MSLDTVLGAVRDTINNNRTTIGLKSVHKSEQFRVSDPPVCWVVPSASDFSPYGSDLEQSHWQIELRLLQPFAPDQRRADEVLAAMVEPMRQTFRAHIKLGLPSVVRSYISRSQWLYLEVNGIMYRLLILYLDVNEKQSVSVAA